MTARPHGMAADRRLPLRQRNRCREVRLWAGVRGAYCDLVPKQNATGGKPRLGRISKLGNRHLRTLLVLGAHAALYRMTSGKTQSPLADWARVLLANKPFKLMAVALANTMARTAWAIMARGTRATTPGLRHPLETAA